MPKATVNWGSTETWQRLMASAVATGVKLDLKEMAKFYGTTYDTLQNRFRVINKEAAALKAEANGEPAPATPAKKKSSAAATPKPKSPAKKDPLHAVASGRVGKTLKKKGGIKQEGSDEEDVVQEDGSE